MSTAVDPLTLIHGDALSSLNELEDESVQTCVSSPPYWGLRDYGTAQWIGGSLDCDHQISSVRASDKSTLNGGKGVGPMEKIKNDGVPFRGDCGKCGARRVDVQIGLEKTPDEYVARLVEIFREVKRVLRADGTLWLNLGDCYASSSPGNKATGLEKWRSSGLHGANISAKYADTLDRSAGQKRNTIVGGLKPKDLVGIPWMVAFALRADGWYLRSDIIWSKPNPMPESVTDRPTKSHEYIFLFSKSERYYYNAKAIAEPLDCPKELDRKTPAKFGGANKWAEAQKQSRLHSGNEYKRKPSTNGKWSTEDPQSSGRRIVENVARARAEGRAHDSPFGETRNKRSVWTVTTKPFSDAHFATFPPDLITPCILAGAEAGSVVLDPFAGSGTTGKVAIELGRKAILIEPKAEYVEMIKRRCQTTIGLPLAI